MCLSPSWKQLHGVHARAHSLWEPGCSQLTERQTWGALLCPKTGDSQGKEQVRLAVPQQLPGATHLALVGKRVTLGIIQLLGMDRGSSSPDITEVLQPGPRLGRSSTSQGETARAGALESPVGSTRPRPDPRALLTLGQLEYGTALDVCVCGGGIHIFIIPVVLSAQTTQEGFFKPPWRTGE